MTDINVITKDHLGPRPKLEGGKSFVMDTDFDPAGDQPTAIAELSAAILGKETKFYWEQQVREKLLPWLK